MKLLPHQLTASKKLLPILNEYGVAYLAGQLRTGKTLTALHTAEQFMRDYTYDGNVAFNLLFITSKAAISSIESDYIKGNFKFNLRVANYEQVLTSKLDDFIPHFLVLDEGHRLGHYPKPGKTAKKIRIMFGGLPTLLLSGTPSPESYSQLFNQFWVTRQGPWKAFQGFYKWAHQYVNITQSFIGMGQLKNNYSDAKPTVMKEFNKLCVTMTQKQAGFDGKIVEEVIACETPDYINTIIKALTKDQYYSEKAFELTGDTAGKLSSLVHQVSSGTVIDDTGTGRTLHLFKTVQINNKFVSKGHKTAIYYWFKEEGEMLKRFFKNHTDNPEHWKTCSAKTVFIKQIRSGREGVNLASADVLVFFNISYSAVSYWQARARSQSFKGGNKRVVWLFSTKGIEQYIYDVVSDKKDFTLNHFRSYATRIKNSGANDKAPRKKWKYSNKVKGQQPSRMGRPNGAVTTRQLPFRRGKTSGRKVK